MDSSSHRADAGRRWNWAALNRQACFSYLIHGEILWVSKFRREGKWGTSIMHIDPNRLVSPHGFRDNSDIRGGVRIGAEGQALEYFISDSNPIDGLGNYNLGKGYTAVKPYGRTGRKLVGLYYDNEGVEQSRGISPFSSAVDSIKRQHELSDAMLKAALIQTLYTMVIKSDLNYESAMSVIGAKRSDNGNTYIDEMKRYQEAHLGYYDSLNLRLLIEGAKAIHLLPNESLEFQNTSIAGPEFESFHKAMAAQTGRGLNMSLDRYLGDFSQTSYSASQQSAAEASRSTDGKRNMVLSAWATDILTLFMEKLFIKRPELLPDGVDFWTYKDELTKCEWLSPNNIVGDQLKAAKASKTRLENGTSNLEKECALLGDDWRENLRQQRKERNYMVKLGLIDDNGGETAAGSIVRIKKERRAMA